MRIKLDAALKTYAIERKNQEEYARINDYLDRGWEYPMHYTDAAGVHDERLYPDKFSNEDYSKMYNTIKAANKSLRESDAATKKIYDRVAAALKDAQKRARERLVSAEEIIEDTYDELQHFKMSGVCKKNMAGSIITYLPGAENFPRAYKYTPQGTYFTIEFSKTGAYLIDIGRDDCSRESYGRRVNLTDTAKMDIIKNW